MATTYTDNLNLQQPDFDDDALITVINNDMAIIDQAVNGVQDGLAIVANGNTHVAISAGQFVYVRNHTTLTEGLYVASSNIAANATLSTSNLTADSAGGLNALNSNFENNKWKIYRETSSFNPSTGYTFTRGQADRMLVGFVFGYNGGMFVLGGDSTSVNVLYKTDNITITTSSLTITVTVSGTSSNCAIRVYNLT